jgi:DNA repair photolyase
MQTIPAKSILSPYREDGWFGSNYTVNLYRGCSHGCIYCDSRSLCYRLDDFSSVRAKADAIAILLSELRSRKRKGLVLTGSMGDPYNPHESEERLTRTMLQAFDRFGFGAVLLTKSDLVVRDIDVLQHLRLHHPCGVSMTVTTADDQLAKKLEGGVSLPSRRFAALRKLSGNQIPAGVTLMPVLPFLTGTRENISEIVGKAYESGAAWVYAEPVMGVSLRDRQRDYFYEKLDEHFPGVRDQYMGEFGTRYWCGTPDKTLWDHFVSECGRYGLACRMPAIEKLIKGKTDVQAGLF